MPIEKRAEIAFRIAVAKAIDEHVRLGFPVYVSRKRQSRQIVCKRGVQFLKIKGEHKTTSPPDWKEQVQGLINLEIIRKLPKPKQEVIPETKTIGKKKAKGKNQSILEGGSLY